MPWLRQANFIILIGVCMMASGALSQAPVTPVGRAADRPQAIMEPGWLRRISSQQGILTNQPCRVCFIGDSLTEFWEHTGKVDWDLHFAPLKAANLGLTADRTEHILERIRRLDFRRAKPELVVLLMGTNNLGMEPPDQPAEVFRAIQKGVAMIHAKMPQAKVLLLTIPPSGYEPRSALRQRIQETNRLIVEASWPATVQALPVYEAMVDDKDHWRADCTLDGTHFSANGYARLAALLAPKVKEMLNPGGNTPAR